MTNCEIHRTACALSGGSFLVLLAGALVTSKQAGLAIPDWPLLPALHGGAILQQTHRLLAVATGAIAARLVWLLRADRRKWLLGLAAGACGTILAEAVLGGIAVHLLLPPRVSVLHACLAEALFALACAMTLVTSPRWARPLRPDGDRDWRAIPISVVGAPLGLLAVAVWGGAFRHRAAGLAPHVLAAGAVAVLVLLACTSVMRRHSAASPLVPAAKVLMVLMLAQLFLGIGSWLAGIISADAIPPRTLTVILTVAHVAAGALVLAASVALAIGVVRDATEPLPPLPVARR